MSFIDYRRIEGLASDVKERLAGIAGSMPSLKKHRPTLLKVLEEASYDPVRGIYCPISDYVNLTGMLPLPMSRLDINLETQLPTFFSNSLMLPDGYGKIDFSPKNAM